MSALTFQQAMPTPAKGAMVIGARFERFLKLNHNHLGKTGPIFSRTEYPVSHSKPSILKLGRRTGQEGFSLVETLVVITIMSVLSYLISAGLQTIAGTQADSEISDFSNTLVRARAYAMANNTYVYVGIEEVNAANSAGVTQTAGKGRIGVTVVASNDGTRGYSTTSPASLTSSSLTVISPLHHYENLHMMTTSGISNLPNAISGTSYNPAYSSGTKAATSLTTFNWPLTGSQYSFGNNTSSPGTVIQFNPQGEAQIVTGANTDSFLQWIEIDLVPSHGSTVPSVPVNAAAILIDGASGSVGTYRS